MNILSFNQYHKINEDDGGGGDASADIGVFGDIRGNMSNLGATKGTAYGGSVSVSSMGNWTGNNKPNSFPGGKTKNKMYAPNLRVGYFDPSKKAFHRSDDYRRSRIRKRSKERNKYNNSNISQGNVYNKKQKRNAIQNYKKPRKEVNLKNFRQYLEDN